jgi:DNA-binding response OmpR family regulator
MPELLIIDNDESLAELLNTYLCNQGYSVTVAENGSIYGQTLHNRAPDPDLIILDVNMPHRNGWESLERIREVSDVPVIMLTARAEEPDILRDFSQGADDYVAKPFSFPQLAARIQAALTQTSRQPLTRRRKLKKVI